ncbi:MAG TPA: ABC transporter permease [Tissierellaceae bacterium]
MLRKIAISGMKGRKKDTFILAFVVCLSFIFTVLATVFHASSEGTKLEQRTAMFGSWDAAYLDVGEENIGKFKEKDEVEKLGISRILGSSSTAGVVGTINDDLKELGNFTMYEGRLPEKDDEIAIELSRLSYFSSDIKVGDTIPVEIVIPLYERSIDEAAMEQVMRVVPEIQERLGFKDLLYQINNYRNWMLEYKEKERKGDLTEKDREPINWAFYIYYGFANSYIRNENSLEYFDGTKVVIKTSYVQMFVPELYSDYSYGKSLTREMGLENLLQPPKERTTEGEVALNPEELSMISKYAHITRDMKVTGIIQNYSNLWDVGDSPVANAFVTEGAAKKFIEEGFLLTKNADVSDFRTAYDIFIGSSISSKEFYNKYKDEFEGLRRNTYAYPETSGSTESTLTYGILAAIFIATVFAVFQIYLTQTKRRTRRIALLKAIGAVNGQIIGMLLWETVYLLLITLPISLALGFGLSKLMILYMNKYGNTVINFHIDYRLTLTGIILGILSVFLGMIVPMIMSAKVPLTGSISTPPRKKPIIRAKLKKKTVDLNMKVQSFAKIYLRNLRYNKGKTILTASLYTIATAVLLGSIFLSFIFFGDYIDNVIVKDKPAYGYEFNYAVTVRSLPDLLNAINKVEGVKRVEVYRAGEHAYLWYENIDEDKIYEEFKEILPAKLVKEHFGTEDTSFANISKEEEYLVKDAVITNIYTIDVEDPLYTRFKNSLSEGELNKEKFKTGEEVILLMPLYDELDGSSSVEITDDIIKATNQKDRMKTLLKYTNKYDITYDFRYADYYSRNENIKVGDTIYLTIPTEEMKGETPTNEARIMKTKVGGIIYYFPEKGIWPFGDTVENPVIISSFNFLANAYPSTVFGKGNLTVQDLNYLISSIYPHRYGKTYVYIYVDKNADEINVDVGLKRIAREYEVKLTNYIEENRKIFSKSLNMTAVVSLLGVTVAVITLIILYNTTLSKLEQERERIGILQALGVTEDQFKKLYLFLGFGYGLIAMIISHILLGLAVFITFISGRPKPLYLYPWKVHLAVSVVVFIIITLTYFLPIRKIIKNQPIDNIRNLGR